MPETVEVPEAELRTALAFLSGANQMLGAAFSLLPGYQEACQAHTVLSVLLLDAEEGMPPDPVSAADMMAVSDRAIFDAYKAQFNDDELARSVVLAWFSARALAAAGKSVG